MNTYFYKAFVTDVYDGDTITCDIDCGFYMILKKQKIRLYGIDTPEVRGEEREHGLIVRDILRNKILNKHIILETKKDKKGKYGRWLGMIYLKEGDTYKQYTNLNEWLIENNHATVYLP